MTSRRFPAPWRADKMPSGYVVRDAKGQALSNSTGPQRPHAVPDLRLEVRRRQQVIQSARNENGDRQGKKPRGGDSIKQPADELIE
jgi:hypothetical protein